MNTRTLYDLPDGWSVIETRHGNRMGFTLMRGTDIRSFRPEVIEPLMDALSLILDKNKEATHVL